MDNELPDAWIDPARIIWVILTLVYLGVFAVGIPARFTELQHTLCAGEDCLPLILARGDLPYLEQIGISVETYALYQVGMEVFLGGLCVLLGVIIFWRRSNTWIGLLVSIGLVWFGASFLTESNELLARLYPRFSGVDNFLSTLGMILLTLVFYLFPDGRFSPRFMGGVFLALVLCILTSMAAFFVDVLSDDLFVQFLNSLLVIGLLSGALAQIYRFRQASGPTQRQQTKWVVVGLGGTALAALIWELVMVNFAPPPGAARVSINIFGMAVLGLMIFSLPLSMAIAILRYRLWDIDLIIRRTLIYSILTGTLALFYFGSVVVLQSIFRAFTGSDNQVALVLSTLAIAALFNPLRQRIQDFIDRRFYRSQYDAEKAIGKFAALTRDQVEIQKLRRALVTVVQETVKPKHIAIWIPASQEEDRV